MAVMKETQTGTQVSRDVTCANKYMSDLLLTSPQEPS